jgi:hypothetical protein
MVSILILPDSHAKPGISNERYSWLARLAIDRKPDIIVDLGDFADMESLSSYDKGKLSGQNRNVGKDIEVAINARKRITEPISTETQRLTEGHRKRWNPRLIALGGNHEQRVDRYVNDHPELLGVLNQDVSEAAKNGWEWYPYQTNCVIEGITFRHCFFKGGRFPVGGVNPARQLLMKGHESSVAGHSHIWNHYSETTFSGRKIHGLIAGCYFGHEEAYAGTSNQDWDRSLTLLHNVKNGDFSLEKISYEEVRHDYGGVL